jgi:hypothetical protein
MIREFGRACRAVRRAKQWDGSYLWWLDIAQRARAAGLMPYIKPVFDKYLGAAV